MTLRRWAWEWVRTSAASSLVSAGHIAAMTRTSASRSTGANRSEIFPAFWALAMAWMVAWLLRTMGSSGGMAPDPGSGCPGTPCSPFPIRARPGVAGVLLRGAAASPRRDLLGGHARGGQHRDLALLRSERLVRGHPGARPGPAGGPQFAAGLGRPWPGAEALESLRRGGQMRPRHGVVARVRRSRAP